MTQKYKEIYDKSINDKENFWKKVSEDIFWYKKPTKILNSDNPPFYKWFEDGITNTCYNALDIHIDKGRGEKIAIIYDSPITGVQKKITYNELQKKVSLFAGALKKQGVNKGDKVSFQPNSEYEFNVDGEKLYRMFDSNITLII